MERPYPPGRYPVVVVGSGPGGLQTSQALRARGIEHAVLSRDDAPGGMFRNFPIFQRLITWTKPYAPAPRESRWYEWFDWNSLLSDDPAASAIMPTLMDGSSYFPSRPEAQANLEAFTERAGVTIRFGCSWESTARSDDGTFVLTTSDGEYTANVVVFAIGMTEPWRPEDIPGIEQVSHYVDVVGPEAYRGREVLIIGKRNSGFELADGMLPVARRITLVSPRPAKVSINERNTAGARARYLQPYEDQVLAGGNRVLDAVIERIERTDRGWRVHTQGTTVPGEMVFDVDDVIAATGFQTPLQDLAELGVSTFYNGGRLPVQTPYFGSPSVPGIYFAGNTTQGSVGLKKHGTPSNSGAVHGFRYNARVLAEHIATTHFDRAPTVARVAPGTVEDLVVDALSRSPELWNQQAYLARVLRVDADRSVHDEGIQPLAAFVDASGSTAIACAVEADASGSVHPVLYTRTPQGVAEHALPSHPLHDFRTTDHRRQVLDVLGLVC